MAARIKYWHIEAVKHFAIDNGLVYTIDKETERMGEVVYTTTEQYDDDDSPERFDTLEEAIAYLEQWGDLTELPLDKSGDVWYDWNIIKE